MPVKLWSAEAWLAAWQFAARAHEGQKVPGSEMPYLLHLGAVAMEVSRAIAARAAGDNPVLEPDLAIEIPVLFYAITLYLFVTASVDRVYVGAGWVFVAFRALHSAVHCTFNFVMLRFYLYLIATVAVWFMIARAALEHFGG